MGNMYVCDGSMSHHGKPCTTWLIGTTYVHTIICMVPPLHHHDTFSYSEELDKWMEVGNSGMFRPEMLRPMGLPEDVQVIAWGLSLERPTMILYGIDNIRDLFGHKVMGVGRQMCPHLLENTTTKNTQVSLSMVKKNPVCRLGW